MKGLTHVFETPPFIIHTLRQHASSTNEYGMYWDHVVGIR